AKSGHRVCTAGASEKSLRCGDEAPVALRVTQAVVDVLEIVQIQIKHGYRRAAALGQGKPVADAVAEERSIGQSGKRIMESLVGELFLPTGAFDNLRGHRDHVSDA